MARTVGLVLNFDARDATTAFKDLEYGLKKTHRAANEFGNILGSLSSELGGVGRALGAVGAALASGSAWGAAAAGVMLLVDHFKDANAAASKMMEDLKKGAREAVVELQKILDKLAEITPNQRKLAELQAQREAVQRRLNAEEEAGIDAAELQVTGFEQGLTVKRKTTRELETQLQWLDAQIATQGHLISAEGDLAAKTKERTAAEKEAAWIKSSQAALLEARKVEEKPAEGAGIQAWEMPIFGNMTGAIEEANREALNLQITLGQISALGDSIGAGFTAMGARFGGVAGEMMAQLGQLISKTIALALAMSATGGPFAWVNLPATLGAIMAIIAAIPKFETGTPYVPRTGLAMVHQGERIIPASQNRGGGSEISLTINAAILDRAFWRREQRQIMRTLARAVADRRSA
jgi:flagellar biosynthesis chaperone FliJ